MLGAIVSLLIVVAAAFAVTKIGGVITLLFIAALVFLAYRRLSLLAFIGELSFCLWLLVKGVNLQKWPQQQLTGAV